MCPCNDRDETVTLAEEPEYRDRVEEMHRELMKNILEREVIRIASHRHSTEKEY